MEKKLKRTILLRLRSWFRGKNYIFKLTLAKIRAKRWTDASLTSSFLPSPLSLHKPGLTNRRIDPAEISAKGNKNTSCNLVQGHDMVFHAAARTTEARLERMERAASAGGWGGGCKVVSSAALQACASSQGEVIRHG